LTGNQTLKSDSDGAEPGSDNNFKFGETTSTNEFGDNTDKGDDHQDSITSTNISNEVCPSNDKDQVKEGKGEAEVSPDKEERSPNSSKRHKAS